MARSVPIPKDQDILRSNFFRESLSQLSDLLEKGEKRGIFSSRMPASIERSIREENLRFMQNRDVFSEDYYDFLYQLATTNSNTVSRNPSAEEREQLNTESVKLAVHFLFNTYYHVRRRQRGAMADWVAAIAGIIEACPATANWLITYLSR